MTKGKDEMVVRQVETLDAEVEAYWTAERMAEAKPLPLPTLKGWAKEEPQPPPHEGEIVSDEPVGPDEEAETEDEKV